ncbi:MAG: anti-sigma-I factor RsgI family protein [Bacillota bacterium]
MSKSGVICRIESDRYYILSQQGEIIMRRGRPPAGKDLGSFVPLTPSPRRKWVAVIAAAAAVAVLATSTLISFPRAEASQYRLAIDINPSLELVYTEDYLLQEWKAFDPEGTELLASLEMPEDVYAAMAAIFAGCIERGLAEDEQAIFVTADSQAPIDNDRLMGAFEGHGIAVRIHVVRLSPKEYKADKQSPLRDYLQRKGGKTELASIPLEELEAELEETIDIAPWHDNPIVQALVEKYLVKGSLVEEMLAYDMTGEEIEQLLAAAEAEKCSPSDLFAALRQSGQSPGQFLKKHNKPPKSEEPRAAYPDWLPEFLAAEFDHPAGQLSSNLRKGIAADDLMSLLVLEDLGCGKLQKLIKSLKTDSVDAIADKGGIDANAFAQRRQWLRELVARGEQHAGKAEVAKLAAAKKVPKGAVLYILARGYSLEQAEEILKSKRPNIGIKEYLDNLNGNSGAKKKGPGKGK